MKKSMSFMNNQIETMFAKSTSISSISRPMSATANTATAYDLSAPPPPPPSQMAIADDLSVPPPPDLSVPHPPPPSQPFSSRCCKSHSGNMIWTADVSFRGSTDADMSDAWFTHLTTTLFLHHADQCNDVWHAAEGMRDSISILTCRTQANREFTIVCKACHRFVRGKYHVGATRGEPESARRDLLAFFGVRQQQIRQTAVDT